MVITTFSNSPFETVPVVQVPAENIGGKHPAGALLRAYGAAMGVRMVVKIVSDPNPQTPQENFLAYIAEHRLDGPQLERMWRYVVAGRTQDEVFQLILDRTVQVLRFHSRDGVAIEYMSDSESCRIDEDWPN